MKNSLIMAKSNHTSVDFWMDCPLTEFVMWININNSLIPKKEE